MRLVRKGSHSASESSAMVPISSPWSSRRRSTCQALADSQLKQIALQFDDLGYVALAEAVDPESYWWPSWRARPIWSNKSSCSNRSRASGARRLKPPP